MSAYTNPLDDPAADPFEVAAQAASDIARLTGVDHHDIALTLGSGWGKAAELIGETTATIPATEVTGFSKPALAGHVGSLRSILTPGGKRVLVIGARTHYYEGHGVRDMAVSYRKDGTANAGTGYAGEGDQAAVNSPAPNVLVMSLAREKQLESVRTYAVSANGREMIESAADVDDEGKPFVRNFRFTRIGR